MDIKDDTLEREESLDGIVIEPEADPDADDKDDPNDGAQPTL